MPGPRPRRGGSLQLLRSPPLLLQLPLGFAPSPCSPAGAAGAPGGSYEQSSAKAADLPPLPPRPVYGGWRSAVDTYSTTVNLHATASSRRTPAVRCSPAYIMVFSSVVLLAPWLALLLVPLLASAPPAGGEAAGATPPLLDVWMVPHAHCDVGWLQSVDGYFNEHQWNGEENPNSVHAILNTVTPALDANPGLRFIWSEIKWIQLWLPQQTPTMQAAFRRIVKNGQFEFVGAGWSQNDEVTTAYYDVIDNQVTGHEYLRRLGLECPQPGRCVRVGWQIDMFAGFSGATPSLWALAGYDAMFLRWEGDEGQSREFQGVGQGYEWLWEGSASLSPNRSRIFAHSMLHNYGDLAGLRNSSLSDACCIQNASDAFCCNPLVGFVWDVSPIAPPLPTHTHTHNPPGEHRHYLSLAFLLSIFDKCVRLHAYACGALRQANCVLNLRALMLRCICNRMTGHQATRTLARQVTKIERPP